METRIYPQLKETVYWDRLSNGLTVAVVPRKGFSKKIAYFAVDYGAIHTRMGDKEMPAGVAHYLEHKLFDMPGRDITAEFAALGASPNAFTSFDMTAYHFSCTENFDACLRLLLDLVSTPYFTKESVEKEQGIIGQEIGMNEDNPDTRVFENLMLAMYENHPIRVPILGTRETISRITPEILQECHRTFYAPGNALLCVVGDVDADGIKKIAMESLPSAPTNKAEKQTRWQEEMSCKNHTVTDQMEVAMPLFQLGFKCEPSQLGVQAVRQEFIGDLAAEMLFGETSELYLRLYGEGVVDGSFGGGFETIEGMSMLTCFGDSESPETVQEGILQEAKRLMETGISHEDFLRMKRSALGRRIRDIDSFDGTCFRICAYYFSGYDYFDFPAVYQEVTAQEVLDFIKQVVTPDRCALSVISPIKEAEQ